MSEWLAGIQATIGSVADGMESAYKCVLGRACVLCLRTDGDVATACSISQTHARAPTLPLALRQA